MRLSRQRQRRAAQTLSRSAAMRVSQLLCGPLPVRHQECTCTFTDPVRVATLMGLRNVFGNQCALSTCMPTAAGCCSESKMCRAACRA